MKFLGQLNAVHPDVLFVTRNKNYSVLTHNFYC